MYMYVIVCKYYHLLYTQGRGDQLSEGLTVYGDTTGSKRARTGEGLVTCVWRSWMTFSYPQGLYKR